MCKKIAFYINEHSLEPIGSKAPAFAGDAKLSLLVRKANMDVSLPCNAQGHPPPISRYEIITALLINKDTKERYQSNSTIFILNRRKLLDSVL